MRGQITLFIIVGIVMLLSIAFVFFLIKTTVTPVTPVTQKDNKVLAKTCLAQSARAGIKTLLNDGFVSEDEGGSIPEKTVFYVESPDEDAEDRDYTAVRIPFGRFAYVGLCDLAGPNSVQTSTGLYLCDTRVYNRRPDVDSIQEQLSEIITAYLKNCLSANDLDPGLGEVEVIIQPETILFRYSEQEVTHTEYVPLHTIYLAIEEIVRKEVTNSSFDPETSALECDGCEKISVEYDPSWNKIPDDNWDQYIISYDDQPYVTIRLKDRKAIYLENDNSLLINRTYRFSCEQEVCTYEFITVDEDEIIPVYTTTPVDCKQLSRSTNSYLLENSLCSIYTDKNTCNANSCNWDFSTDNCYSDPKIIPCNARITQNWDSNEDKLTLEVTPGCKPDNNLIVTLKETSENRVLRQADVIISTKGQAQGGYECEEII